MNTPRAAIAECGTDDQRQALIEDEEWGVHEFVARCGADAQRQELINDPSWLVRTAANGN